MSWEISWSRNRCQQRFHIVTCCSHLQTNWNTESSLKAKNSKSLHHSIQANWWDLIDRWQPINVVENRSRAGLQWKKRIRCQLEILHFSVTSLRERHGLPNSLRWGWRRRRWGISNGRFVLLLIFYKIRLREFIHARR